MQQRFFDLIEIENKKGATVLFSSHILPEVQKLCTRVAIIKDGSIVKIENMDTLRNYNYKKIMVELAAPVSDGFFQLDGITNLVKDGSQFRFLFRGDINRILDLIHGQPLKNLLIEEPSLEEIFMHYYQKEATS